MAKSCTPSNMSKEFKMKSALRAYADGGTVFTAADALRKRGEQIDSAVSANVQPRKEAPPPPQQKQDAPKQEPQKVQPHPDYKPRGLLRNILGFEGGGEIRGPGGPREDKVPAVMPNGDPARLSNGEYVLPVETVEALGGPEKLDKLVLRTNGRQPGPKMVDGVAHASNGMVVKPDDIEDIQYRTVPNNPAPDPKQVLRSSASAAMNTAKDLGGVAADKARGAFGAASSYASSASPQQMGADFRSALNQGASAAGKLFGAAKDFAQGVRTGEAPKPPGTAVMNVPQPLQPAQPGTAVARMAPQRTGAGTTMYGTDGDFVSRPAGGAPAGGAPGVGGAGGGGAKPPGGGFLSGAPDSGKGFDWGKRVGEAVRSPLARTAMGKVGGVASILPEALDERQIAFLDDPNVGWTDKARQLGRAGLRVVGGMGGATVGGAAGSVVPVAGTVTGAVAGGYGGTQLGNWVGEKLLGDPMAGYKGGGPGPNPQRAIADKFFPAAGSTAGTEKQVNNAAGLRALDNAQRSPQPDVQEAPAGPAGTGINRIDGVPGLNSSLYTNVPREQAIADMKGGTVSSMDMRGNLRAMAAENAIRQSSIDAQDRRDAEEAQAARNRYTSYLESSANPETDRFGKTAAERDMEMAEFRTRNMDPRQRAAELAGAKEGLEQERKTSALRAGQAATMRKDDTEREQNQLVAKEASNRTDALRQKSVVDAQIARARAEADAKKQAFEQGKYNNELATKNTEAVDKELATRYGVGGKDASPETLQRYNTVRDRVLHTLGQAGIALETLDAPSRNELYKMADDSLTTDENNASFANRFLELIRMRQKTGTSRNLLKYQPTGFEGGIVDDDLLGGVGAMDAQQYVYGNGDFFTWNDMPDVDRARRVGILRRGGQ